MMRPNVAVSIVIVLGILGLSACRTGERAESVSNNRSAAETSGAGHAPRRGRPRVAAGVGEDSPPPRTEAQSLSNFCSGSEPSGMPGPPPPAVASGSVDGSPETAPPDPVAIGDSGSTAPSPLEERWGIRIASIRRTAGGYMLDFRYRVVDPEKAKPLFDRAVKPYLVDQATGAKMFVPSPPKAGPLRTTNPPQAEKSYFVLFANPGGQVKPGGKVTVVIGDFRAEDLTVQ